MTAPGSYNRTRLSMPLILIIVNVAILLAVILIGFVTRIAGEPVSIARSVLDLPAGAGVVGRLWSPVTYMFTHSEVMHCLFNMLWLYWFGMLWLKFSSARRLLYLYLAGGLGGAVTFTLVTLLSHSSAALCLEGASGAVMGIVTATAIMVPNFKMNLMFLGNVKLKWIALATIVLFALGGSGQGIDATWAHLGGAVGGALYALWLKYMHNRPRITARDHLTDADARAELDMLLDKVRTSGYASLTDNERRRLLQLSHRV